MASLGSLYKRLITHCDFTTFWQAYESTQLIQLMDRKGFRQDYQSLPDLESFLTKLRDDGPCVWRLKQFCDLSTKKIPKRIYNNFGFGKCNGTVEQMAVKEMYKKLLRNCNIDDMSEHLRSPSVISLVVTMSKSSW